MAILAAVFGVLGRFVGKLLTAALGWASTLLFGRVPQDKQIVPRAHHLRLDRLDGDAGRRARPDVGTFLLAAVPVPSFIDKNWVRVAMLVGAIVTPLLIGGATAGPGISTWLSRIGRFVRQTSAWAAGPPGGTSASHGGAAPSATETAVTAVAQSWLVV